MNVSKIRKNFGSEELAKILAGGEQGVKVPFDQFAARLYQIGDDAEREKRIREYLNVLKAKAGRNFSGKLLKPFVEFTEKLEVTLPDWMPGLIESVAGEIEKKSKGDVVGVAAGTQQGLEPEPKVNFVTKWPKMKRYFGEDVIETINKGDEKPMAEAEFVKRILTVPVVDGLSGTISKYLSVLEDKGPKVGQKGRYFAIRQIKELRVFAEENGDQIPEAFRERVAKLWASLEASIGRREAMQREALKREPGRYPEVTCLITELGKQDMEKMTELVDIMKIHADADPQRNSSRMPVAINATHIEDKGLILSAAHKDTEMPLGDFIRDMLCKTDLWFSLHEDGEPHDPPITYFWRNDELTKISSDDFFVENETEKDGRCPVQEDGLSISKIVAIRAGGERREIDHVHYIWKDHTPAPNNETLLESAKRARRVIDDGGTVGINCHMGIGRTGELSAAIVILGYIDEQVKMGISLDEMTINIPEILYGLRRHRSASDSLHRIVQLSQIASTYVDELRKVPAAL